jgi:hypothetical protein
MSKTANTATQASVNEPVVCCVCGQTVSGSKPLEICVNLPDGATQQLWAHGKCFAGALHSSVPFLPEEIDG